MRLTHKDMEALLLTELSVYGDLLNDRTMADIVVIGLSEDGTYFQCIIHDKDNENYQCTRFYRARHSDSGAWSGDADGMSLREAIICYMNEPDIYTPGW